MSEASPIWIRKVASGLDVPAELFDEVEQKHVDDWKTNWKPAQQALMKRILAAGVPRSEWPQSAHWNWEIKLESAIGMLSYRALCITCEGLTQALMRLELTTHRGLLPEQKGLNVVYIDYLEVAPWNWKSPHLEAPRFTGLGRLLVGAAVEISKNEGFQGRVGLHSLPQADAFYGRIGMENIGKDASKQDLSYFEFTQQSATVFLNQGGSS